MAERNTPGPANVFTWCSSFSQNYSIKVNYSWPWICAMGRGPVSTWMKGHVLLLSVEGCEVFLTTNTTSWGYNEANFKLCCFLCNLTSHIYSVWSWDQNDEEIYGRKRDKKRRQTKLHKKKLLHYTLRITLLDGSMLYQLQWLLSVELYGIMIGKEVKVAYDYPTPAQRDLKNHKSQGIRCFGRNLNRNLPNTRYKLAFSMHTIIFGRINTEG